MKKYRSSKFYLQVSLWVGLFSIISGMVSPVRAQEDARVQEFTGSIQPGQYDFYLLTGLERGQMLSVFVETTSGNLDPFVGLTSSRQDIQAISDRFQQAIERDLRNGEDPLETVTRIADQNFLTWDDDSGPGYAAALQFRIPNDGDYRLLIGGALSILNVQTFGEYRLQVGINAPMVIDGKAQQQGIPFARTDLDTGGRQVSIEEYEGELTPEKARDLIRLHEFEPGDRLFVYVEALSEGLRPIIGLLDYGEKPLRTANLNGQANQASFEYTFTSGGSGYLIDISAIEGLDGEYRLLAGLNQSDVLSGEVEPLDSGVPLLKPPTEVKVGVKLQQITEVNQKAENYRAVASIRMDWRDPNLAFSPDTCNCRYKAFTGNTFDSFVRLAEGDWPEFTLLNQQDNRWTQNKLAVVYPDGSVTYFERFTTTFQAPDFNFKQFPFDTQEFYIRIASLFSEDLYTFSDLPDFSEVGDQLGEEEWYIIDWGTIIEALPSSAGNVTSQFSFHFDAQRYLNYYIFRILVPIGLILIVSWVTFWLKDYDRRIGATSANLLVFVAFNFTVSNDLPRLGYLTYLDAILIASFIITVFAVIYNVALKWLEMRGKKETAERIDIFMNWLYPLGFLIAIALITVNFF